MADRGGISDEKRVKLYLCNDEGQWADQGTGYVAIAKNPTGRYNIVVRSETEADASGQLAVVLNTPLSVNDIYEMQGATLIVWEDPFMSQHLALSFQSAAGCNTTFETIKAIQQGQVDTDDETEDEVCLPEPEITSLGTLHETLVKASSLPLHLRRHFAQRMAQGHFLDKLFTIFDQCEDLDDVESLHHLFRIFVAIVLFNDLHVLSKMFDAKFIMKLMGVLEYDPIYQRRLNHRQYLQSIVKFKEAVQLKPELKAKIHDTFKLQYFKDSVIPRYLDEATSATLNGVVVGQQTEIIGDLCRDDEVMENIAKQLKDGTDNEKLQVLGLVQEMQMFAKSLLPQGKAEFLAALCANGILHVIADLMVNPQRPLRRLAVDIISQSTQHEPGVLRGFIVDEEDKGQSCPLLVNVVTQLVSDTSDSERVEMLEILRQLLEAGPKAATQAPERLVVTAPEEMNRLLDLFYDTCIPIALRPLLKEPDPTISSSLHLLDLLCFCVAQHGDYARRVVLQHGLVAKATALFGSPYCTVQLSSALARFLKAIVATRDEAYCPYLVRAKTFQVLSELLLRHRERCNLLFSTILATLEVIRSQNIKLLVCHVVEEVVPALPTLTTIETVSQLQKQWNLMKDKDKAAMRDALRLVVDPSAEPQASNVGDDPEKPNEGSPAPTSPICLVAYGEEDDSDLPASKKRKVQEEPAVEPKSTDVPET